ncbi:hypothetical protein P7C71_g3625, partial [Lecanoromycetidae sp. Uapishka_2]
MAAFTQHDVLSTYKTMNAPNKFPGSHYSAQTETDTIYHDNFSRYPGRSAQSHSHHTAAEIRSRNTASARYQLAKLWLEDFEATAYEQRESQGKFSYSISQESVTSPCHGADPNIGSPPPSDPYDSVHSPRADLDVPMYAVHTDWGHDPHNFGVRPFSSESEPSTVNRDADQRSQLQYQLAVAPANEPSVAENLTERLGGIGPIQDYRHTRLPTDLEDQKFSVRQDTASSYRLADSMLENVPDCVLPKARQAQGTKSAKKPANSKEQAH